MRAMLTHSQTGALREVPLGFGWTTLFFGIFPALFRGDFKNAIIMFFLALFTFGISALIMPFIYNKMYVNELISKGWMPADDFSSNTLRTKGILFMNTNFPLQSQQPQFSPQQNHANIVRANIVCNVCQLNFDSPADLDSHKWSDLHKKNMENQHIQD